MKKGLMYLSLAAIGLASCNGGFKKGQGGMLYDIVTDKPGPSIKTGDFISLNITLKNDADSVMGSTYDNGQPYMQMVQKSQRKGDMYEALDMLSEGDSAVIKLNIDSLTKGKRPPEMKGKYQVYTVKVEKVIAKGNLNEQVFNGRVQDYVNAQKELQKKAEPAKIKKYIDDNKLKVIQTASGLDYIITKPGSGPRPAIGDTAVVNYTVKSISGKVYESSIKSEAIKAKIPINPMNPYKPIRFPLGVKGMIQGMDEGIQLLNKGAKATLVLPSSLAYGEQGNGMIPPFTSLVFDVELVDIVPPNPNAPKPAAPVMAPPVHAQRPVKK